MTVCKDKYFWLLLCLALSVRAAYLGYNVYLDMPAGWHTQAREMLYYAQYKTNSPCTSSFFGMNEAGARQGFQCSDNGLAYIHILIAKICRKTSFLHLQVLQMVLDALLVFPIMRIGRIIGSERVSRLSGMAYAAFLPEIWLAAVPGYDFWASFGLIVSTWIFLESWTGIERGHKSYFLFIVPGSALIGFCGVVRSTVFFYPIFFILLTPLFYKLPKARYALAVVCALVGWSMAAVPKMIQNYRIYGTAKLPGRKSPPKIPGASSTW